jgi:hypothetical protein
VSDRAGSVRRATARLVAQQLAAALSAACTVDPDQPKALAEIDLK